MEKDNYKTDVIFRIINIDGLSEVTALFPHEAEHDGTVVCYAHLGQHGNANYVYCVSKGRLATEEEYAPLKEELEGLGYDLNIMKKQNRGKFLKSYYETGMANRLKK